MVENRVLLTKKYKGEILPKMFHSLLGRGHLVLE